VVDKEFHIKHSPESSPPIGNSTHRERLACNPDFAILNLSAQVAQSASPSKPCLSSSRIGGEAQMLKLRAANPMSSVHLRSGCLHEAYVKGHSVSAIGA